MYLPEVDKYFIEDLLPHSCHLLKQFGFEGGDPNSLTRPEAMKDTVKLYRRPYPPVYYPWKRLL